jgi:osmotically-inducible protein OsmY
MNLFKTSLLATAVALTFGVSGVNAEDHKDHTGPERTVGQAVDDATITASVKSKLLADERTKGFDINVDTRNGSVILSGGADSQAAKMAAGEIASSADGVILIDNQLVVADPGTAERVEANTATASGQVRAAVSNVGDTAETSGADASDASGGISDAWITSKVKTQLLADTDVKGTQITVQTRDKVVTLSGAAETMAARAKAIEIAQGTEGVNSVVATELAVQ